MSKLLLMLLKINKTQISLALFQGRQLIIRCHMSIFGRFEFKGKCRDIKVLK